MGPELRKKFVPISEPLKPSDYLEQEKERLQKKNRAQIRKEERRKKSTVCVCVSYGCLVLLWLYQRTVIKFIYQCTYVDTNWYTLNRNPILLIAQQQHSHLQ